MDSKVKRLEKISEKYQVYLSSYEALTENERKELENPVLSGTQTLPEWQKQLEAYATLGENRPKNISLSKDSSLHAGCVVLIFIVIMFFVFGITLSMIGFFKQNGELLGQVIVGSVLVSIIPFVLSNYFKRYVRNKKLHKVLAQQKKEINKVAKVPTNELVNFIMPLIQCFSEEIPKDTPVELQIDLRNKRSADFVYTPENPVIDWKYYQVPWFTLKSRLIDGAVMELKINYLIRYRRYSKKGRSGKWKAKEKIKVKIVYELAMAFPKKRYQSTRLESNTDRLRIKENEKRIVVKTKAFRRSSVLDTVPELSQVLQLAKSAYTQIQPTKG